jgi:hypothetical protein
MTQFLRHRRWPGATTRQGFHPYFICLQKPTQIATWQADFASGERAELADDDEEQKRLTRA